ncbi:hypothetical protein AB0G74_30115 [Streptomyces sp. NPDC020875]|uniref:hypothetical protein n=1 Tax=Streptomyces sp. NPDC020875 TaxID=3154898 RepID=UPI003400F285
MGQSRFDRQVEETAEVLAFGIGRFCPAGRTSPMYEPGGGTAVMFMHQSSWAFPPIGH